MARGYTIDPVKLHLARVRADLTQVELAALVHTTASIVSAYEHGRAHPSIKTIHKLAAALDVDPADLLAAAAAETTLAALRVRAGRTQADLAHTLNINDRTYSAIESGRLGLTPQFADQLAHALGASVEQVTTAYLNARRQRQRRGAPLQPLRDNHIRSPEEAPVPRITRRGPKPFTPPAGYQ